MHKPVEVSLGHGVHRGQSIEKKYQIRQRGLQYRIISQ